MFDEKTIYTRLAMALCDAITIERIPARRHEMERLLSIMRNRYKPEATELQHQAILKKPTP
jgi:hypothetical protein